MKIDTVKGVPTTEGKLGIVVPQLVAVADARIQICPVKTA
jgi:hypothetical protein